MTSTVLVTGVEYGADGTWQLVLDTPAGVQRCPVPEAVAVYFRGLLDQVPEPASNPASPDVE